MMEKPTNLQTLKIYWSYWMRYPWSFAGCLLMGPAYVLQTIFSPLFIAKAIGQLAAHHSVSTRYIVYSAVSMISGLVLWCIIDVTASANLLTNTMHDIYRDSFNQIIRQDYEFFSDNFSGSLVTQANRFAKSHELFHITFLLDTLGQVCAVLVALAIMIVYSPPIGLLIAALWFSSIIIVIYLVKRRMPRRRLAAALESKQTGELADAITNALAIKTFAAEGVEDRRYDKTNRQRATAFTNSWDLAIKNNFVVQSLCIVSQLTFFIFGVLAVENHEISIATFLLFQVYLLIIINSLAKSTLIVRQFEGILGDSHEMTILFSRTPKVLDQSDQIELRLMDGTIELQNIVFDYVGMGAGDVLFKDFTLKIKSGERVGLVGPSGGGKTTITKLLLRFMDVQDGVIKIGGQDIRAIGQDKLHESITYVPQEPLLFHRSLFENISYGKTGATKIEVMNAAKRAHAHEFITSLPQGYDTLVGERGVKLSGGQRQRVAIARAMLSDASFLILDEATSALDSESERHIQSAFRELMDRKTSVVIAHRLSTIKHLDRIVVLDKGIIVEEGTHNELLKNKGLYSRLWKHQSGGFIEE